MNYKKSLSKLNNSYGYFHSSKKAEINQVFVYLFSIIIISFAGFLVIQFVGVFTEDVESRTDIVFFDRISSTYEEVSRNWNSEELASFRVTGDVKYACFMEQSCDTGSLQVDSTSLATVIEGGDNIALYSQDNLIQSGKIGSFETKNDCFCIEVKENSIELFFENKRNDIFINP